MQIDPLEFDGLAPFRLSDGDRAASVHLLDQSEGPLEDLLSPSARDLLAALHRRFNSARLHLLAKRAQQTYQYSRGEPIGFLASTADVRTSEWTVAAAPPAIQRRWVELTGPAEPKMIVNALNSGADVFMADLEDALSPTWPNIVAGHRALRDAAAGKLVHMTDTGREYRQKENGATLFVRPRGLHLDEPALEFDREPTSASLVDFGLAALHGAKSLLSRGAQPCFYLPKLEGHLEARWWNDIFTFTETWLGLSRGTIRATVLIETLPAAFQMDEILHELREHSAGLNAGRWDYIFSAIKKMSGSPAVDALLPDRAQVTMRSPFLSAYAELLVRTCHRRGATAIGGMAAFIPNRQQPEVTAAALVRVQEDKRREADLGFHGSWVAHPDLISVARQEFSERPAPTEKLDVTWSVEEESRWASRLLDFRIDGAQVTENGVRTNLRAALSYLERWLEGTGAVAIDNLMEDAATAEISRTQLWHWLRSSDELTKRGWWKGSQSLSLELVLRWMDEESARLIAERDAPSLEMARRILEDLIVRPQLAEFLTLEALPALRSLELKMQNAQQPTAIP
jgi:malate synthase